MSTNFRGPNIRCVCVCVFKVPLFWWFQRETKRSTAVLGAALKNDRPTLWLPNERCILLGC